MNKNLLFSYSDLSSKDKASKAVARYFTRAGIEVISQNVSNKEKTTSGVKYKEILLAFKDDQTVTLKIKSSGDIFNVLINKKLVPIKNQDNHIKAISEIVKLLNSGRAKFSAAKARVKVVIPPSARTSTKTIYKKLAEQRDTLKEIVTEKTAELAQLKGVGA